MYPLKILNIIKLQTKYLLNDNELYLVPYLSSLYRVEEALFYTS